MRYRIFVNTEIYRFYVIFNHFRLDIVLYRVYNTEKHTGGTAVENIIYKFDKIASESDFCKLQITGGRRLSDIYHSHDFYELILVIQGSFRHIINGNEYTHNEGDLVILRPGDTHGVRSQEKDTSVVCLSVNRAEFEKSASAYGTEILCDFSPDKEPLLLNVSTDFGLCRACALSAQEKSADRCGRQLLGIIFPICLERSGEAHTATSHLKTASEKMKSEENLREGLPAFLRISGYSHTHLARLVKKEFGCTLHEYIFNLRLEEAYRRVVFTSESFECISACVGYESFSHFCRIFKKHFGITPSALRKKHGFATV